MTWWLIAACAAAAVPAGLRWLRVAQREHYLPGEVTRFSIRWWEGTGNLNRLIWVFSLFAIMYSVGLERSFAFVVPVAAAVGPVGLSLKGTTSPLAWTPRLRRLAILTGLILAVGFILGGVLDQPWLVSLTLFLIAGIVDVSLWILQPYEKRLGNEWVEKAEAKLRSVGPEVVAITGSYGKTTTKNYLAHLLGGSKRVVASPASFNNRMGLARAINENLVPGTDIFIAEMGTYGYGEIAELCEWIPPKVAAMVSVGPVHLERFGSTRDIALAKSEILDRAEVGVICVDYPELRRIADERADDVRIVEVSASGGIHVAGERVMDSPQGVFAENLAVAVGICVALGLPMADVVGRTKHMPKTEHRQSKISSAAGFTIIDDTFNSNPAGARSALVELVNTAGGGRVAVVTPGMVEMGERQEVENEDFAKAVAAVADDLVVVGRTNREALLRGSANGKASVTVVKSREEAVEWVKANLGPGDAVLYENDLPDHYP